MIRALVIGFALLASPASAEGWSIFKLGSYSDVDDCMQRARDVVSRYMFDKGGAETGADSWSVYGYDLEPQAQDVVIMCPVGGGDMVNAILVVQSESEAEYRVQVAEDLVQMWDER
ncbi:hypothetical protein [Sinisalibacter aestuarii]|uniref:Uncharacterized protein n=1 Tax=Sinisalibacter aestuarii TaxID=2949426 RepID=A0ABQ5LZ31_9RHOB|nr:hypothetical protein [Sinisalibacter aestuarii]GKY90207.1 hypothetical protein STA1M1_40760 [Sinisalibacter aestuarii]